MRENRHNETSSAPSDLIRKEQEHRHQLQEKYLRSNSATFRLGQIFGFIYNLALLYLVFDLIQNGEKELAVEIFAINAAVIAFALIFIMLEKKFFSKRSPRRGGGNNRRFQGRSNDRSRNERSDRSGERSDRRRDDRR